MKVYLAQQNYHIGNFALNKDKIISAVHQAKQSGADLIVFSELSVCGYPPRDFLEFEDFILHVEATVKDIALHSFDIGIILGAPTRNLQREGKDLFNSGLLLYNGEVQGEVHKTLLPTYDVFDEYRYFEPAFDWNVLTFKGKKIALTICEDIWNLGDNPLYRICPMDELMKQSPDLMINISASPFDYHHDEDRKDVIRLNVMKYKLPMIYCNTVGSQTEIVFDGGSLVYDRIGNLIHELNYFEEDIFLVDTAILEGSSLSSSSKEKISQHINVDARKSEDAEGIISRLTELNSIAQIKAALVLGIRDYFTKMGFSKAILGSSGGIDSAVVLTLAVEALGSENVTAVLMPSAFSSEHSVADAVSLSKKLGTTYHVMPIESIYDTFLDTLDPLFGGTPFGVAEENIQSRSRGNILMAIANKFGFVLLNTSNKSELATGYGTLYGDMAGGISVLGDLYKVQIYALANYINRAGEIIPQHIIDKAPSAELRPGQKDSDSLPEYDVLDAVLYLYIEQRMGPSEIIAKGFDELLVRRILKLVNSNEYKRNQFCPIIRVSSKAFGIGRRVPIVAKYLS